MVNMIGIVDGKLDVANIVGVGISGNKTGNRNDGILR